MNIILHILILAVLNGLLIYSIYQFFGIYFKQPKKNNKCQLIYGISYLVLICISMTNFIFIYDFILYFVVLLCITTTYTVSNKNRFFIGFLCLIFIEGIEMLSKIVMAALYDTTVNHIVTDDVTSLMAYSMARIMPFVLIKIYVFMKKDSSLGNRNYDVPKTMKWFVVISIPILSMLGIIILSRLADSLDQIGTVMMVSVIAIFLMINILYLYIYDVIIDRYRKRSENIILNKQIEYYHNQHNQVESNINEIRQIKHDLKFKLIHIMQNEDIIDVKRELSILIDETKIVNYLSYTGHHGIDSILNYEVSRAKQKNIQINIKVTVCKSININSKLLCVLLGNAMDNGIEANENTAHKYIDINILSENNSLYISIKNPYIGKMVLKENYTSKQDTDHHGFGLKSINDIANQLGGKVKIDTDNNIFTLEILIFDI